MNAWTPPGTPFRALAPQLAVALDVPSGVVALLQEVDADLDEVS